MKSRLGIMLATAAAAGCAAFLILGADAQDAAAPSQPPASDARPLPPPGPGARDFGPRRGGGRGFLARFSPQDRAAFFDAHIAAVKAGLELSPDQEKLWGPAEQAVRDLAKAMIAQRQKFTGEDRSADPVTRLRDRGDAAVARGQALQKLADAAQPLWASLSDDQKRRLPILMRGMQARNNFGPRAREAQGDWRERLRDRFQRRPAPRDDEGASQRD
ncbi:MAG TPA: Spy/CpxP family protein refolding chaperone [Beijerinckiaceae bacterium]|nr:Spy/CpxP family protein refolding chaperone [Beijerinckiaceae bacterium]